MRRAWLVLALAAAAPRIARAGDCPVAIVRAPDDVRLVIAHALEELPRCRALEVRVVPMAEGGLYVVAKEPRGHIRERTVPTADDAAVLVTSWADDDPVEDAVAPPPPAIARVEAPAEKPVQRAQERRTIGIAALGPGLGARLHVDCVPTPWFALGVAAAWASIPSDQMTDNFEEIWMARSEARLGFTASRAYALGPLELGGSIGGGLEKVTTRRSDWLLGGGSSADTDRNRIIPTAEATLRLTLGLGNWAAGVGVVSTARSRDPENALYGARQGVLETMGFLTLLYHLPR